MTRYIDADMCIAKIKDMPVTYDSETVQRCIEVVSNAPTIDTPTIDAVPVIRCKDCKFYEVAELNYDGTPDKRCKPSICVNGWYEYAVERDPNWFCADAEPKETE